MGADVLFICHTQYQAMVSVVKVLCAPEGFRADFWLSAALPARAQLAARLQEAGLAGRTCPRTIQNSTRRWRTLHC